MFHAGSANQTLGNIEYAIKIRTSGIVIGTGYGKLRKEQGTGHKEKESERGHLTKSKINRQEARGFKEIGIGGGASVVWDGDDAIVRMIE
ncbi:hypothetical protein N7523_007731 [Penicillium sp. IBT 18751x]|nr:hypothetical protein N7523_007731 [Penicillium sp. IBT 18751x]